MVDLVKARKKANDKKAELAQLPKVTAAAAEPEALQAHVDADRESVAAPVTPEGSKGEKIAPIQELPQQTSSVPGRVLRRLGEIKAALGTKRIFSSSDSAAGASAESAPLLELLLFSISGETYAVPIEKIVEIIGVRPATRVPNSDDSIVGIISLRGTIVTILDLRRRLGHSILAAVRDETRIIVVEQEGETAGFVVDKVSRVVRLDTALIGPPPTLAASDQTDLIRGVFQHGNNLAILLDLEKLLRS